MGLRIDRRPFEFCAKRGESGRTGLDARREQEFRERERTLVEFGSPDTSSTMAPLCLCGLAIGPRDNFRIVNCFTAAAPTAAYDSVRIRVVEEAIMRQRAELNEAFRLYEPAPVEEMTPLERRDIREPPSAVWTAWVLLVLVLAGLAIWSSGPAAYELASEPGGAMVNPSILFGP
jgi:hypothetical protein